MLYLITKLKAFHSKAVHSMGAPSRTAEGNPRFPFCLELPILSIHVSAFIAFPPSMKPVASSNFKDTVRDNLRYYYIANNPPLYVKTHFIHIGIQPDPCVIFIITDAFCMLLEYILYYFDNIHSLFFCRISPVIVITLVSFWVVK